MALDFQLHGSFKVDRIGVPHQSSPVPPVTAFTAAWQALDAAGLQTLAAMLDAHLAGGGLALVATHQPLPCAHAPMVLDLGELPQ